MRLAGLTQGFGDVDRGATASTSRSRRRVLRDARPVGVGQDHGAADDRRLRAADRRARSSSAGATSPGDAPFERDVNTVFQDYALFPHMTVGAERRVRTEGQEGRQGRAPRAGRARRSPRVRLDGLRRPQALAALRRPAPAGRARPRPGQPAHGAAARRAARRARPQAARADAGRAQGDPARRRHHLPVRDPRPGGGADDERPHRGLQPGPDRAGRHRRPRSTSSPATAVRRRLRRHLQPAARRGGASSCSARTACSASGPRRSGSPPAGTPAADSASVVGRPASGRRGRLRRVGHALRRRPRRRRRARRARSRTPRREPVGRRRGCGTPGQVWCGDRSTSTAWPTPVAQFTRGGTHDEQQTPARDVGHGSRRGSLTGIAGRGSGGKTRGRGTRQPGVHRRPSSPHSPSSARRRGRASTSSPGPATPRTAPPTRRSTGSRRSRRRPAARSTSRSAAPPTRWSA